MATQTIEFGAPAGQTVTARLFAAGSDTVVATATATSRTNATGIYTAAFTDLAPGLYRLIGTNAAGTLLCQWWVLTAAATGIYQGYEVPPAVIADQVWDEAYSQHTTAGTFGKLQDSLRKANTVLEGTILASPTPTTTVFRLSGIDYPTGALVGSVLWMSSGASQEQNSPILTTLNNGDGTVTVTLQRSLVTAPTAGDTALIDPTSHVYSVVEIQAGLALQSTLLLVAGYIDTEVSAIKTVTDKLNTGLVADGAVFQFTANMLELAPGGGGGGSATIENQELILEELDTLRNSFAAAVGRLAVASQIVGFPAALVRDSDYSTVTESDIRLSLNDLDGNPITEIGGVPCDEIEWLFGLGSERAPAIIEGAATWDDANSQLVIQIDADDTAATPLGTLSWQIGCTIDTTTRYLGGGTTRLIERQF